MKKPEAKPQPVHSRRRVLRLLAATSLAGLAAGAGVLAGRALHRNAALYRWRGTALGADASLLIHHPEPAEAARLTKLARDEIERLEKIFSLHRQDSALFRLNRAGRLDDPPVELVALLSRARAWSEATGGAFDVTVQPLWELYRGYFANPAANTAGPPASVVARVRDLVDFRALDVNHDRIALRRPGMAVTLNGIAQGAITDRVTEMLHAEGLTRSLIDLGEMRTLGTHPEGRPWKVGIKDPHNGAAMAGQVDLTDRALATSSITGTTFEPTGRQHHLFDPKSGRPSRGLVSASVIARRATDADACSTALLAAREPLSFENAALMGVDRVLITDDENIVRDWHAPA